MTCYLRHLKQVFEKAGIQITPSNKKEVDRVIHNIVGVNYKNCSDTWRHVKNLVLEDEENFASMLKEEWSKRTS